MIKAVIADDEPADLCFLKRALESTGNVAVVGETHDGAECARVVQALRPDVVFLDISMPDLGGIEVADTLLALEPPPAIVFVTGHDEHAVKAFELAAFDYVVKSADLAAFGERVEHTVSRLMASSSRKTVSLDEWREAIGELMAGQTTTRIGRLPVKDHDERTLRLVDIDTIVWAERCGKQTVLHTTGKDFPMYASLAHLAKRLIPAGFSFVSRAAIVNLKFVEHLIPNGDGTYDLILKDAAHTVVTASRSGAKRLLNAIGM